MQLGREVMPGERLRAARQAVGIGQRKLAKRCYYTKSTVANVEHGQIKMSMALARAAAKELHVSAAWLLGLDEPEISYETALAVIAAAGKDKLREVLEKMEENT